MPELSKSDEVNLLIRAFESAAQPVGWHRVLDFIDNSLNCKTFLAEFDENGTPSGRLGGYREARELSKIFRQIETADGRNALQFLLSEAALHYPYCKTSLERRNDSSLNPKRESPTGKNSQALSDTNFTFADDAALTALIAAPGLISPISQSENSRVLLACLFTAHTPDSIDVAAANEAFRTIVQSLTPALEVHFKLEKERAESRVNRILLCDLDSPAVLITADAHIEGQSAMGIERLEQAGAAVRRGQKLVFTNKQLEAGFHALQSESRIENGTAAGTGHVQPKSGLSVCVPDRAGHLKRVSVEPVQQSSFENDGSNSTCFILRISETGDLPEEIETILQDHYDLSHSEARLARHLTLTGSMDATADSLGITRNTAKTHLRRVYEKIGVHTQLQLAGLVHKLAGLFRHR